MRQLPCPVDQATLHSPDAIAIETENLSLTYKELDSKIRKLENYLHTLVTPFKKLGILALADIDTIALYFAALRQRYSVCFLNPKDPPLLLQKKISELDLYMISNSDPHTSAQDAPMYHSPWIPRDHLSTYLYTSGSSSDPKIAVLSFENHYMSALGILDVLHLTSSSRYLLSLPLYHVSGLSTLFRTLLSRSTLVISKFQEISASFLLERRITHLSLVFTQYVRLLQEASPELLSHLKAILLGGSAFSESSLQEGAQKNLPIYLSYGLTEMASTVCCNPLFITKNYVSSGFLLPYRTLKISEEGELLVGGSTLFQGYYCPKERKILPIDKWFPTRDLATYTPKEGLIIQGRVDRMMISGGENIQPEEIELQLLSIPGIHKALIFALPDPLFGQKMVALIEKESHLTSHHISDMLTHVLPRYKIPKHFVSWPHHLQSSSLKISAALKQELYDYILSHESL